MKKWIFLILMVLAVGFFLLPGQNNYKEGDIVFQMSQSQQSPLIQYATASPWSHCGIIIEKKDGLYVLEASNVVKLTPLQKWIDRGRFNKVKKVRIIDEPIKVKYKKYLGIPYDLQFKFDNGKYYCSELVWVIYKEQFGKELCEPRPIKDYHTFGIEDKISKRGMKLDQMVVAPSDLIE